MKRRIFSIFISSFASLLCLQGNILACGWSEMEETVRLASFRAQIAGMSGLRPFLFSAENFHTTVPDPEGIDRRLNCLAWQERLGGKVTINDIDVILYHVKPETFELSMQQNRLGQIFDGNTFIEALLAPGNEALLRYLAFAKTMEFQSLSYGRWENWDDAEAGSGINNPYAITEAELPGIADPFLKERYAFMLTRFKLQNTEDWASVPAMYDTYLKNSSSIIGKWGLLFKALAIDAQGQRAEANYLYSQVFASCEEKKLVAIQNFNRTSEILAKTLAMAKNSQERANILAMATLRNAGPALDTLQLIYKTDPNNAYFLFLVGREINKLEDWIFTPMFTEYGPTVARDEEGWYNDYEEAKKKNYTHDIAYLRKLRAFLKTPHAQASGTAKHYLALALAHLAFMDDDLNSSKELLSSIPSSAEASIITQKEVELALVAIKTENIQSEATKQFFAERFSKLEKMGKKDREALKTLYSLLRIMAQEYRAKKGDVATAAQLFMQSELKKHHYEMQSYEYYTEGYWEYQSPYFRIGYLDRFATVKDMDNLLGMINKQNKTAFERFLCEPEIVAPENFYKDLKGTIAFRENDLEMASRIFEEIPESFWQEYYEYKSYLDQNPFEPKAWEYAIQPDTNYQFSKRKLLKEMLALKQGIEKEPGKKAEYALQLGHAYFNVSYWGNSWMMSNYSWGSYDYAYQSYHDMLFSSSQKMKQSIQENNYYKCNLAKQYYQLALQHAVNDEQKAMANFMIHICDYSAYLSARKADYYYSEEDKPAPYKAGKELFDLFNKYEHTQTFERFRCAQLEDFIEG